MLVCCEYNGCENVGEAEDFEDLGTPSNHIYVCQSCIDKVENQSGYCSMDCQLGYGCDHSC